LQDANRIAEDSLAPSVLLVEDEVLIRLSTAELMRDAGFRVFEAANGDEAWSFLQAGPPPDVVFTDVRMPGAIDGVELARRIALWMPHLPVLITSGHLLPDDGVSFMRKPYATVEVIAFISASLGLRARTK
jgi:CheY-like chemotaxis protein